MKKHYFLVLIVFFISSGLCANYSYELSDSKVFVKIELSSEGYINLPFEYNDLKITSEHLIEGTQAYLFSEGNVSYYTEEYLQKAKKDNFFILNDEYILGEDVVVILPEGSSLSKNEFIHPKNYELVTNGKNIILKWERIGVPEILISYADNGGDLGIFIWIGVALFLLAIFLVYINRPKKNYSENLFREEKEIVNYLLKRKNHSCWTKEISKELEIPKVRLSRKIRNLVEKGLVEKEPHGNENRIKLKK